MTLLNAALKYRELGFSVIPCSPNKRPYVKWEPFQHEIATPALIQEWWNKWPSANIGIITGRISGLFVLDIDGPAGHKMIDPLLPESLVTPTVSTPRGGNHYYFQCPEQEITIKAGMFKEVDYRCNGGYVLAPPSTNGNGKAWAWMPGLKVTDVALSPMPKELLDYVLKDITKALVIYKGEQNEPQNATRTTKSHKYFDYGTRDNSLFHAANLMTKAGGEPAFISEVLERLIVSWGENPDQRWIDAKIKSAFERLEKKDRNITDEVYDWVMTTNGHWKTTTCHNELQITTKNEKKAVGMALCRLKDKGIIEKHGDMHGCYIKVDKDLEEIDWETADDKALSIELPFDIHRWVEIMPKNIVVIAGVPNAGKTAFLLNTAILNVRGWPIRYLSSEMDATELKKRLAKFEGSIKQWKPVKFYQREQDFAAAIDPNGLNIIDFLEITDKFYLVAERLREYHRKLEKGVLFVAIQKDQNKDYGRGGGMGLEKPRLYINLDKGKLKIVKAKNWATDFNPNGMQFSFKLLQGCKFIITDEEG